MKAKSGPLVSILVPTYNGARFLDQALRSARRQTYQNIEVLIRDDGSRDETTDVAQSFCQQDRRFVLYPSDGRRLGGTGNMIELLRRATGEFVKYLHQDDVLEPTCVERLVRPLRFDETLTMSTSSRRLIDTNGDRAPTSHPGYKPLQTTNGKRNGVEVVRHMVATRTNQLGEPSVALFRNHVVSPEQAFVLDDVSYSYMNDMALWTNLLLAGDLYWHAAPLSNFRTHSAQRSAQLAESITAAGELAHYVIFGVRRGFVRDEEQLHVSARHLANYLTGLHDQSLAAPAADQAELAAALAEAVAAVRELAAAA